jgi:DNA mismatch repair protein MutS
VAQLAGVPGAVIRSARKRLGELEAAAQLPQGDLFSTAPVSAASEPEPHPAVDLLRDCDPDALSPREALELVYRLRQIARGE